MLTEAEVRTQQRVPLPRTASFDTTIARRADPVSGPVAVTAPIEVVDISVAPSTDCRDTAVSSGLTFHQD